MLLPREVGWGTGWGRRLGGASGAWGEQSADPQGRQSWLGAGQDPSPEPAQQYRELAWFLGSR